MDVKLQLVNPRLNGKLKINSLRAVPLYTILKCRKSNLKTIQKKGVKSRALLVISTLQRKFWLPWFSMATKGCSVVILGKSWKY